MGALAVALSDDSLRLGLLVTALAFAGVRHGIDRGHIDAIVDITTAHERPAG